MKLIDAKNRKTPSRRKLIIEAALACFTEIGYERAGMEDIRNRSGASTGSIYHHFKSKEQLASEVYLEGIREYQAGFILALEGREDAFSGIYETIRYHMKWVQEHPDWSRFLFQMRRAEFMGPTEEQFHKINEDFFGRVSIWFGRHIKSGAIRRLPADLYVALFLGPIQEYTRMYLSGHARSKPDAIADELAQAVWRAIGS